MLSMLSMLSLLLLLSVVVVGSVLEEVPVFPVPAEAFLLPPPLL
jgi:hypothetical protein